MSNPLPPWEAEARARYYASKARQPDDVPELYTLRNVEIFSAGKWNGDEYTMSDLDDIVAAYRQQGFVAAVKAGHDETPGRPALGWVENVRRVGRKLLADFTHLPKDVYQLIKRRGYDRVSSEIYWNLRSGVRTFRRALKAVALLGADVPAVTELAPLHSLFSELHPRVRCYTFPLSATGDESMKHTSANSIGITPRDANAALHTYVVAKQSAGAGDKSYDEIGREVIKQNPAMARFYATKQTDDPVALAGELLHLHAAARQIERKMDYTTALREAQAEHPALARVYANLDNDKGVDTTHEMTPEDAGIELNKVAVGIANRESLSYSQALRKAMQQRPDLAERYNNISTHKRFRTGD